MRILHIIDTMDPAAGGPPQAVRMLAQYAPTGYTCEIVTTDAPNSSFFVDFPCPIHGVGASTRSFYTPGLLPWLRKNRSRFDAAIVHGLWQWHGIAARRAFRGTSTPYAVFPHGMLDPYFKYTFPLKHLKKYPFWLLAEFWNLRDAHRVLFTTHAERELAAQSFAPYECHPAVVPLGTDPEPPDTPGLREAFFAQCPTVRNRRFILYLGRIHPKKGANLLLDAFTAIAAQYPDVDLVMAGPESGSWGQNLRDKFSPELAARIHWPGMLSGDAKHGAFAASEAFILPSHQENFGIAIVEALAAARPVLLTHAVNTAAEITAAHAGFAEPDTPAGIRALLAQWLALTPEARAVMSANALHTFTTRYDIRRNAPRILSIFQPPTNPLTH